MAIEDAVAALQQHWPDVTAHLGPGRSRELSELIQGLGQPDDDLRLARMAELLAVGLPPGHPVVRALFTGDLFAPATLDWPALTTALRHQAAISLIGKPRADEPRADEPGPVATGGEMRPGEPILAGVAGRLLRAPALTEEEVRRRGADPGDSGLIGLERADVGRQWPAFQFAPDGGPVPVVREVNQLLDAAANPLGAADWWLSRNSWLGDQPSQLLGRVPDDYLVRAARAVGSEV